MLQRRGAARPRLSGLEGRGEKLLLKPGRLSRDLADHCLNLTDLLPRVLQSLMSDWSALRD
jgi:hypothetical protein